MQTEIIQKTIQEFLEKMGFETEASEIKIEEKAVFAKIKTEEPQILIGQGGQTLFEIQHLLRLILRRKLQEVFFFDIDINDYKEKKFEYLREMAQESANDVALTKKEKELEPMPAYERRIIHLELSKRTDVKAESLGEEPERRIIIKPSY